jgi:hypothetical protein
MSSKKSVSIYLQGDTVGDLVVLDERADKLIFEVRGRGLGRCISQDEGGTQKDSHMRLQSP